MSKYGNLSRSNGHSKWFLQKTLLEHDKSMDHPWMQMIYDRSFSIKQYAAWLARNHQVFKALESKLESQQELISSVHDAALHRTVPLEEDLARLLGPSWQAEVEQICSASPATKRYLEKLEEDASNFWLLLSHHFLQYNAVLSGGAYLGQMVSQKLCCPHGAPGVRFYAFEGIKEGKESARVQQYLRDFDKYEIAEADRDKMLKTMKQIYADTEEMMSEVFELNPVKGIKYNAAKDGNDKAASPPPCEEQLAINLAQLNDCIGEDGGRILISIAGELLDVSSGRELYGPGGAYSVLAGHDVTRCLATMSLESDCLDDLKWEPDCAEDEEALNSWRQKLKEKYPVAGKLDRTAGATSKLQKSSASSKQKQAPTHTAPAGDGQKCPVSGKEGTCPMAAIMGIGAAPSSDQGTASGKADQAKGFMAGKSLVASVEKQSGSQESLLYRLCPLHWDDKTIKMVVMIAITSWVSGIAVGWNLRKILLSES
eukprot:TRINITY_DN82323_c0_g1_i1.p1 TRINITY_DN82323_c0_g1~~TRINITY_DN82323_c0_g1_i1.p1  ORF type:complete len:484 (-),score=113.40 TRINITY_DN82323_c0_g1_i1:53-1504(-)